MQKFLLFLLLTAVPCIVLAQEEIGLTPPSTKWRQLHTPAGKVIFPTGLDSQAHHIARIVNYERRHDSTVNTRHCKTIPIILQNRSSLPAGFATPAPWRLEAYLIPPQNNFLGTTPWVDALTLHEYRHAQQFWAGNKGFTRIYQALMGETGWILNSLLVQPLWYREGDAVFAETIFTTGGRGREPEFMNRYRALRQSGLHFNYEQAVTFSFRDYTPHIYHSGYLMVSYARQQYGEDIWKKVLNDAYTRKGFFWPFSRSLKKFTGLRTPQLYSRTMDYIDSLYDVQAAEKTFTQAKNITTAQPHHYINYHFPHYVNDSLIVTGKSSFDQINTFYLIHPGGKEEKLFHPGIYSYDHVNMDYRNGMMTWAESRFDKRWRAVDYSVVMCYDFKTRRKWQVKKNTRWFSPAFSPDGKQLVVVENTPEGNTHLLFIEPKTGNEIKALPNPLKYYFSHPCWAEDMKTIYTVALGTYGNTIVAINARTGKMKVLLPFTQDPVKHPVQSGKYLYFSAGWTSIQNIFALNLETSEVFQLTESKFGAYEPAISQDGRKLLYGDYSAGGFQLSELELKEAIWQPFDPVKDQTAQPFEISNLRQEGRVIADIASKDSFPVSRYRPFLKNLLNVYGWFPLPNIPEYGAEFYTRDIMSRHQGTLGLIYNTNEAQFHSYARYTYAGLYPIINLEFESAGRRSSDIGYLNNSNEWEGYTQTWHENIWSAGLSLPLNFTRRSYRTWITPEVNYQYINYSPDTFFHLTKGEFHSLHTGLDFQHVIATATRHLNPRWGQIVTAKWDQGLSVDALPEKRQVEGTLYFPGLKRPHSLCIQGGFKTEETNLTYRYRDDFIYSRGYKEHPADVFKISGNYSLPLFYPDWALGSFAFFHRFHLNIFYDYSEGKDLTGATIYQRSAGCELFATITLFRLFYLQIGPQFAYKVDEPVVGHQAYFNVLVPRFVL